MNNFKDSIEYKIKVYSKTCILWYTINELAYNRNISDHKTKFLKIKNLKKLF